MALEGESARGIFYTAGAGRNFRRRKNKGDALQRFAEALSHHVDEDDIEAGEILATGQPLPPNTRPDPGGDPRKAAQSLGLKAVSGNGMLQRIRKQLGRQAC
jgi:hypothetical protein